MPSWYKDIGGQFESRKKDSKMTGNEFRKKLLEGSAKDIGNRKLNTDASFHDRGAIDAYLDEVVNAIGEKWVYKVYKGEDGKADGCLCMDIIFVCPTCMPQMAIM